jgi:predicted RNA-binding protein with PUA-like domain
MAFWLMKSEPSAYSWNDLVREGHTHWDGVRNYQAANNMKSMKVGDMAFFYHSVTDKEIVGIMQVVREYYPDHTDKTDKFGMVDVEPVMPTAIPVTLARFVQDGKGKALTNEANLCAPPQCASLATHIF